MRKLAIYASNYKDEKFCTHPRGNAREYEGNAREYNDIYLSDIKTEKIIRLVKHQR